MAQPELQLDHEPVMLSQVCDAWVAFADRVKNPVYVDCTLGEAGHALALLQAAPAAVAYGFDRDPVALERARARLAGLPVHVLAAGYDQAPLAVEREQAQGRAVFVFADLGIGSHQLASSGRGFSYQRREEEFDLRFDPQDGMPAWRLLSDATVPELGRLFNRYGDLRVSGRVLEALIVCAREGGRTVGAFLDVLPEGLKQPGRLARFFQALRIAVNDELGQLERLLDGLEAVLKRMLAPVTIVFLSYHSLEDRAVKHRFRDWQSACACPPSTPVCVCDKVSLGAVVGRKGVKASAAEVAANPRARSAVMRIFEGAGACS